MSWLGPLLRWLARPVPELDLVDGAPLGADPQMDAPDDDGPPPLAVGPDGWLVGEGVVRIPTARPGYRWRTADGEPGGLLWHWTATAHGTARRMVRRMVRRTATGRGASVHLWVEADGTIYQSVPLTRGAGHAGSETAARLAERGGRVVVAPDSPFGPNSYLVGIELVNVGEVRQVGGRWMGWPFGKGGHLGPVVPADQVVEAEDGAGRRRHYQEFTPAQVAAGERIVRAARARYGFDDAACSWGHVTVDPTRKSDPGPRWLAHHLPAILARAA